MAVHAGAVVADLEPQVAPVGDRHADARAGRVAQRVRQRLLHDPVGGHVEPGRQLDGLTVHGQRRVEPRAADLLHELVDAPQRWLRRQLGAGIALAQDAQHPVQLADRLAAGLLDAVEHLALAGLVLAQHAPDGARLQHHHGHAVGDGVVELARDPRALVGHGRARVLDLVLGGHAPHLLGVREAPDPPREHVEAALRGGLGDPLDPAGAEVDRDVGEPDPEAGQRRPESQLVRRP